jgi:hypothetical protein
MITSKEQTIQESTPQNMKGDAHVSYQMAAGYAFGGLDGRVR